MERTKTITYQSCDLCDSIEEAKGECDICGKHLCEIHCQEYPWADQMYQFCPDHFDVVLEAINITGIPIGLILVKLKGEQLSEYGQDLWDERGYEEAWKKSGVRALI